MARRPRVDMAGYYHIINRGVEKRVIFLDADDYEYFEELLEKYTKDFNITMHNYALMTNHYHLLIETHQTNLSKFMRQINANYAIYFNKKYKRVGHLWQGRFKSWFVTNKAYLYTLIIYIEQNPIKANIVERIEEYPYSSGHIFLNYDSIPKWLRKSYLAKNYKGNKDAIREFLYTTIDQDQLKELKTSSSLMGATNTKELDIKKLKQLLQGFNDKTERNRLIVEAYKMGYSQHRIAKVLGVVQSTIHRIIKNR